MTTVDLNASTVDTPMHVIMRALREFDAGSSISKVAASHSITEPKLYYWLSKWKRGEIEGEAPPKGKAKGKPKAKKTAMKSAKSNGSTSTVKAPERSQLPVPVPTEAENRELRKENTDLKIIVADLTLELREARSVASGY